MSEPRTEAGKRLAALIDNDDLILDTGSMLVAEIEAEAAGQVDGVYIGPIQHSNTECRRDGCDCWCHACERHNASLMALRTAIAAKHSPDLEHDHDDEDVVVSEILALIDAALTEPPVKP